MIHSLQIKNSVLFLIIPLIFNVCFCTPEKQPGVNTSESNIHLADPAMFFYNNVYYLYGTVEGNAGNGFIAYTSTDMIRWEKDTANKNGYALQKGNAYGSAGFWAPQVFTDNKQIYMAYTANENIAIARSMNASGPFTQDTIVALEAPVKQIDPYVFIDTDGKKYLYHVRLTNGNKIFVAEMEADLSSIIPGTLKECITATDSWENTRNADWPVIEGPSVLKHKGTYYLFYSANDFRNPDYAVGYATSNTPVGPWKKYRGNPILDKTILGINGPGHGDFIKAGEGTFNYVFHTHFSGSDVAPRRTAIVHTRFTQDNTSGIDKLVIDRDSFRYLSAK